MLMFSTWFKTTLRNLLQNKGYSVLNIAGLAIGIACAALIFLWVEDEMQFNQFHEKKDRLYFVRVHAVMESSVFTHASTPGLMGPAMQTDIPGIANSCRMSEGQENMLFRIGDKSIYASGRYAEPSVFSMFTFPFVQGNAHSAFAQLHSIVITEKTARKFFGNDLKDYSQVIGKTVRADNKQDYVVTGVLKDIPSNSTLQFGWLIPFEVYYQQSDWTHEWGNNCISTYVELKPGAQSAAVNKQLYNYVQQKEPRSSGHCFLFPMNDWQLYDEFNNGKQTGGGRIVFVRLFSIIAWIILFVACINFMNLATARSDKRAREVGVRKVLGAGKKGLILQFIGEAICMAFVAAIIGMVILTLVLPGFNALVQKKLTPGFTDPLHIGVVLGITLICGLVAGSYPSLYLSSFQPVMVLKGLKVQSGSAAFIRKGLVVLQFTVSIVLIISTIIIFQQLNHVKSRNLGFNKDNLIEMDMRGDMAKHFDVIQQELINTGMVQHVALSDHPTIYDGNNTDNLSWQGKKPGSRMITSIRHVTPEFIRTFGMRIVEGRDFITSDSINLEAKGNVPNVIITKSLARLMGNESPIGKILYDEPAKRYQATVVGVVDDYVYGDMYGQSDPVVFVCLPPRYSMEMYARIKEGAPVEKALSKIEAVMKKNNPAYPFQYRFVDDQFNDFFTSEMLMSKLSRLFAALAIIISCLGLFGLAAYTAERRTKEIGIRKVLGASVTGLARLLSKEFLQLVAVSCLIAFPLAWWSMHNWLQNFAYRTSIHWWVFGLAGIAAILIALCTVSFQAVKAAIANPVKSLRTE
jgi:putative ABC transport system permease protein